MNQKRHLAASILVCPADRVSAFDKAFTRDVRELVFDLEDSISAERKDDARDGLIEYLISHFVAEGPRVAVRVNEVSTKQGIRDIIALCEAEFVEGISLVVPKLETEAEAATLNTLLDSFDPARRVSVQLIIESSRSLIHLQRLVDVLAGRLTALVLGPGDLLRDMRIRSLKVGVSDDADVQDLLAAALRTVLLHARAGRVKVIDGPVGTFGSTEAALHLRKSVETAVALGVDAKWVIHPSQIEAVNAGFTASPTDVRQAGEMWHAYQRGIAQGKGVVDGGGTMIDKANAESAGAFYDTWKHLLDDKLQREQDGQ